MLIRICVAIGAAAFAAALGACSHASGAAEHATIDPAKARQAYAVGQRLAAQDRAQLAEHRSEMARVIGVSVPQTRDEGRTVSFFVQLRNKSAKMIRSLDAGVEVHDTAGRRIGLTEIHLRRDIAPKAAVSFWLPLRYVRFSEDAGTMRLAAGKPKRVRMDVTEVRYADGSDAGYDE